MITLKSHMKSNTWLYVFLATFFTCGTLFTLYDMIKDFELVHGGLLFFFTILTAYFVSEVLSSIYIVNFHEQCFKYRRFIFGGIIKYEDIDQLIELKARKRIGYTHYVKVKLYDGTTITFSVDCLTDKEKEALKNSLKKAVSKSFVCEVSRFY